MKSKFPIHLTLFFCLVLPSLVFAQTVSTSGPNSGGYTQEQKDFIASKTQQNQPTIELSVWTGFMFGGKYDRYGYYYNIEDAQDWGGAISVEFAKNLYGEFTYNFMGTQADYRVKNTVVLPDLKTENININYFQLGAQHIFGRNDKVQPFGTISLGMTYFNREKNDDIYAFSGIFGAGVKVFFTDNIGIRLQGRFMVPMYFNGIGFTVGTGGTGGGAYWGAYTLQGDFSGGLIFRIK